ncbi:MAG: cysteine desulfurase family protein [bacterium]|nr:cysteine desulfurase family protein [bacterium]
MKKVYLDHAATTPVDPEVFKVMRPYFSEKFGNPMSIHGFGQEALEAVDKARKQTADFLNCQSTEIIFTSGATESNNLAIKGVFENCIKKQNSKPHIITTSFEHHCVLNSIQSLEKSGKIEATYLPVYKDGVVKVDDVKKAIRPNTILASVMYVNNEIGTVQPIAEIGNLIKSVNSEQGTEINKILFHTDATQAINYFDCDVEKLGVNLLSLSGHKIYGPKGVGVLYVRKNSNISRVQDGGDQEFGMRAGTHNVPGIVGLGKAIESIYESRSKAGPPMAEKIKNILELRNYFIDKVLKEIPNSYLNGSKEKRSPNNINFRFDNAEGESLILALDQEGIAASTGSACSSGTLEPSHALMALGIRPEQAHGSLRLTLGKDTTKEEVNYAIEKLKEVVDRLRGISGNVLKEFK